MPTPVRVRRTTAVALPAPACLPPPGQYVALSVFDVLWVPLPPLRRVLLFPPPPAAAVPFPALCASLQRSLARALTSFHPFAGELAYSPTTREVGIVCGGEGVVPGVAFVEAEADYELGDLAGAEEAVDADDALGRLAPDIRRDELPAPVMAVQVTELADGAVAVGLALHHAAADGRGLWRFLGAWAAAATGGPEIEAALHDRRLVRFDGEDELAMVFLQHVVPDLPRLGRARGSVSAPDQRQRPVVRRAFTISAATVSHLKHQLAPANDGVAPSTFATLAAHAWVSFSRASGFDADDADADADADPVFAGFVADCRAHLSPPIDSAYAGNCLVRSMMSMSGSELAAPDGLARALSAIREAVKEVKAAPLKVLIKERDVWATKFKELPPGRVMTLGGSPHFPAYAVDLGFGTPARSEPVSMGRDGQVVFSAGREPGSVQASVALDADKMPVFREMFARGDHRG